MSVNCSRCDWPVSWPSMRSPPSQSHTAFNAPPALSSSRFISHFATTHLFFNICSPTLLPTTPVFSRRLRQAAKCMSQQLPRQPENGYTPATPSPVKRMRTVTGAAVAAVLATTVLVCVVKPTPAHAFQLAPTPINAYAQRRQEKAYQAYMQQLESRFEAVTAADLRKVVQKGGGGLGISYRVAGFSAFIASACSTAIVHPLDTLKTRIQDKSTRIGRAKAERERRAALRLVVKAAAAATATGKAAEAGEEDRGHDSGARGPMLHDSSACPALREDALGCIAKPASATGGDVALMRQVQCTVENSAQEAVEEFDEVAAIENEKVDTSGLYRGIFSNILKEAPNSAIYLAVYEIIKNFLLSTTTFAELPLLVFLIAGALGDAIGSVVRCPAEIVNKRLQLGSNDDGLSAFRDAFLTPEGRQASVVAWGAVLLRDVPYGGLQIALYELGRQFILTHAEVTHMSPGLFTDVITGAIAGMIAAMVTTPADVLVTRLSVQNPQCYLETRRYMDVRATLGRILREEGGGALFSGILERGIYYAPLIGLFFALYEATRGFVADPHTIATAFLSLHDQLEGLGQRFQDVVHVTKTMVTPS